MRPLAVAGARHLLEDVPKVEVALLMRMCLRVCHDVEPAERLSTRLQRSLGNNQAVRVVVDVREADAIAALCAHETAVASSARGGDGKWYETLAAGLQVLSDQVSLSQVRAAPGAMARWGALGHATPCQRHVAGWCHTPQADWAGRGCRAARRPGAAPRRTS